MTMRTMTMRDVRGMFLAMLLATLTGVGATAAFMPTASAQESTAAPEGVVNLNTATEAELSRLPGIGGSKARAIIAHRQEQPFRRVEDILRVRGIGRATFRRLRPNLAVQGQTTLGADR